MKKSVTEQTTLQHLLNISIQLTSEKNTDALMEKVLVAAIDVAGADAGSIYLVNLNKELEFRTVINKSLSIHLGGQSSEKVTFPNIPLFIDGQANKSAIVAHSANTGEVINVEDVYDELPFDFSAARKMDKKTGYRTKSMLTFPMRDHTKDIIGVIQLINALEIDTIIPFSKESERTILSFASLGAIALTNRSLIHDMEQLFESFAKTIAGAIDEKSPHTGGHCKRVPELTLMIADAVHQTKKGLLSSFSMSLEERHQLSIAGWLHDCGKIGTPDHIMEKSTKLETIFDRIEYVTAKLEIASRDIDLRHQEKIIEALKNDKPVEVKQLERLRDVAQTQVSLDRAFLQRINIGGEFLTDEQSANIAIIGKRYSISLGGVQQPLLSTDEMTNLNIKRGTLNDKERLVIQRHMTITQDILEALPFPKHLSKVTEYALGHHETLDGKGYPQGLTKEQMSVPARAMAIADIFEALSAADRPYKQAKPVSECLKIMGTLVTHQHLDGDLFTIFVRENVYKDYINKFANPEQLDEFDVEAIPGLQCYNE
ncbi:MAG: HD domain-containing phosphohydrolase [Colwellia sp.]|jgi:metal dependent phosphohydrolase